MIPQNVKKQIIDQTNIVEVVGESVQLTKRGSSYFGLCPFHDDKHPSMSVNNDVKLFNCFSCNTKGNVIYFVSRFNNISEDEATIILAKRLGIQISTATTKEVIKKERLYKVMDEATSFYQFYLNNSEVGLVAKKYLSDRGISDELIKKLRIGLAPKEKNYLSLALKQKKLSEIDQIDLGLVKLDENNTAYDIFRSRIMFPIENNTGQVVGFSGRIFEDSNQAKYINSTDNYIFHKGQILYNFHNASSEIRKNDKVIIYEGFMDVIASIKSGMGYGVATMGTALTPDHIKAILNLTKNITLCFDGDEAGIHAMKRSSMMFANYGIIPKAVVLPNNMDPDEYRKAYGDDALSKYFTQNEKNVFAWIFELARRNYIKGDLESTEKFKNEIFDMVRYSKQNTIVEHFLRMLAEITEISYDTICKDYSKKENLLNKDYSSVEVLEKPQVEVKIKTKPVKIKKKVYLAYNVLLRHLIYSKDNFLSFMDKMAKNLYIDPSLVIYFEFIKKMEIYYATNDIMDEVDFFDIAKSLDSSSPEKLHLDFAKSIIDNKMVDVKNKKEFDDCLRVVQDCLSDLAKTKLYNKAILSKTNDDIKEFEAISKKKVKILHKED